MPISEFEIELYSPLSKEFTEDTPLGHMLGYNHNGLAYAFLFIGGGLALGFGAGRLRFAHLALWAGFASSVSAPCSRSRFSRSWLYPSLPRS